MSEKNQEFKVGQRVKINSGANIRTYNGSIGVITEIDTNYEFQPCIRVKTTTNAGVGVWCYPGFGDNETYQEFDVEILEKKESLGLIKYIASAPNIELIVAAIETLRGYGIKPDDKWNNERIRNYKELKASGSNPAPCYMHFYEQDGEAVVEIYSHKGLERITQNFDLSAQWTQFIDACVSYSQRLAPIKVGEYDMKSSTSGKAKFGCESFTKNEIKFLQRLVSDPVNAKINIHGTDITPKLLEDIASKI